MPGKRKTKLQATHEHEAVKLLLRGRSVPEVADEIGVSTSTIERWKRGNAYKHALAQRQERIAKAIDVDTDYAARAAQGAARLMAKWVHDANALADVEDGVEPEHLELARRVYQTLTARKVELTGKDGGPLDMRSMSLAELRLEAKRMLGDDDG